MKVTPYERIRAGLRAYAAGDAAGVPWEGMRRDDIPVDRIPELPNVRGWGRGATSDDTALTLLVAEALTTSPRSPSNAFLAGLSQRAPNIRGLGPSTRQALNDYCETGSLRAKSGNTNGAAMRALPVGWHVAPAARRRAVTLELSAATHGEPEAQVAALAVAGMAASALEGAGTDALIETAMGEATFGVRQLGGGDVVHNTLAAVVAGTWAPSPFGISLDPADTVAAVAFALRTESGTRARIIHAVSLGGDTDTVAALVGGISATQLVDAEDIEWLDDVRLPVGPGIDRLAAALAQTSLMI